MDIKLIFDPISGLGESSEYPFNSLYKSVHLNIDKPVNLEDIDIAIIGLKDNRNAQQENNIAAAANVIRKHLYKLKRGSATYRVADLGNLRNGPDVSETQGRLSELLHHLFEKGIFPLIIGGTHDFDYAQYQAYELSDKLVSFLNVDATIDIDDRHDAQLQQSHIHKIMLHEPNYLFNFIQLAHQSYFVSSDTLDVLEKLSFQAMRLGKMRDKPEEVEPTVREADLLSFDLSAIQSAYMKAVHNPNVFGLSGEEACQLCWYVGNSEKLSSAGFYGYDPMYDDDIESSAQVVAIMLWYFIEGFYNRKDKEEFTEKYYLKYIVAMAAGDPAKITFYKSIKSDRWWMEIPMTKGKGLYDRNYVVPCSYDDYLAASKGEVPERWITALSKLI